MLNHCDLASGVRDDAAGLDSCRRAVRKGDVLIVYALGRNLARLVDTVQDLSARGVGLRVLASDVDAQVVDTTISAGRLVQGDGGSRAGMLRGQGRGYADAGFSRDAVPCVMRSSRNNLASRRFAKAAEEVHSSGWSVAS